jgi:hypothetical protein
MILLQWSCWWCYDNISECVVMWLNVLWYCTGQLKTWTQCCFDMADDAYFWTDVNLCFLLDEAIILDMTKIFHHVLLFISVQFALEFSSNWCLVRVGPGSNQTQSHGVSWWQLGLGQATASKSNTKMGWAKLIWANWIKQVKFAISARPWLA